MSSSSVSIEYDLSRNEKELQALKKELQIGSFKGASKDKNVKGEDSFVNLDPEEQLNGNVCLCCYKSKT